MATDLVFETHATTDDNESSVATGWLPGRLSTAGRSQAKRIGQRRAQDSLDAIFSSDLYRAVQTVRIAFPTPAIPVLFDWRLRECDYGDLNGHPTAALQRGLHLDSAYPGGESWRQAVGRVGRFLTDLDVRWNDSRVLVIGHTATRWAFDHFLRGVPLEDLVDADFAWQEGWEYRTG